MHAAQKLLAKLRQPDVHLQESLDGVRQQAGLLTCPELQCSPEMCINYCPLRANAMQASLKNLGAASTNKNQRASAVLSCATCWGHTWPSFLQICRQLKCMSRGHRRQGRRQQRGVGVSPRQECSLQTLFQPRSQNSGVETFGVPIYALLLLQNLSWANCSGKGAHRTETQTCGNCAVRAS